MERNINIKIDIDDRAPTSYNDLIKVGDSINLTIDLLSKGESVDLRDSSVELFLKKEDGTKVEQEVIIGDSKVSCTPLNIQSTTVVGQVCGELVVESSGKQVTSSTFIFNVEGSTSSEILEESKDDIATIKSLQNTIVNVNSVVEKYKTNIEAIAGTSESIEALAQIKIYAESAVTEIETVVNTGNTLKTSLESENTRAENNIQELNNLGSESIKTHINNTDIHVAASDKTKWDSYEQLISDNASHLNEIANKNLIINGEPLIWQRATSLVDLQDFCADRWEYICWVNSGPSGKIEKDIDGSMKISQLNSDGNYVRQLIESSISSQLANQKLTLSADIKAINATTGNAFIQLVFSDGVDTLDGSSTHKELIIPSTNLTSDYQRFVLTLDVPGTTNTVAVQIGCHHSNGGVLNTDCILNIKNIKLEIGEKATPFKSELYADTLIRCMRYFQFMRCNWIAYSSNILWCANGNYFVPMRVIPTVTPDSNILDHFGGGNQNITGKFTYAGITKESLFYIESSAQEFIPGDKYSGFMRLDSEIR